MADVDAIREENKTKAWTMYAQGYSIREIALEFGVSKISAQAWISETMAELQTERRALASAYIERELASLDAMERFIYETQRAAPGREFETVAALLKVKERRAKYLALDKPAEVKHTLSLEDLVTGSYIDALPAVAPVISIERGGTPEIAAATTTPPPPPKILSKSDEPL